MEAVSKTLTINVSLGHSHRKIPASPVVPRPVSHIFAETNIKENNLDYQQLLIKNKELELGLGELKAELNHLQKQRRKGDKLVEEASQRRALAGIQLKEKQFYLQRYHDGLDRKFRGGRDDLFAGLKKLEQNLLEMY